MDEEHYIFVGNYFLILMSGSSKIEDSLNKLKLKYMTPEERQKYELIERQQQEYREEMKKKQEYVKLMQK